MDGKDFEQEPMRVARIVNVEPLSEASMLVTADAKDIVKVDPFKNFVQDYPCKTARAVMYMNLQESFM